MIISDAFLWLHLPKTGGTSMNHMFHERQISGIEVDDDSTSLKHDSVALREGRSSWRADNRSRFITSRRLEHWLISDWEHKRRHMQLPDLDFEPVRSGLFYSLRLGGTWVAADWWLQYFELDQRVTALRLEELHDDLNRLLLPLLPEGTTPFQAPPRENARPTKAVDHLGFSAVERHRIAAVNPKWDAWQKQVYGAGIAP